MCVEAQVLLAKFHSIPNNQHPSESTVTALGPPIINPALPMASSCGSLRRNRLQCFTSLHHATFRARVLRDLEKHDSESLAGFSMTVRPSKRTRTTLAKLQHYKLLRNDWMRFDTTAKIAQRM